MSPRPVWVTVPGPVIWTATYTAAASAGTPAASYIRSALSTPFCRETTTVPGARSGASTRAADSVSGVFTETNTTADSLITEGSVVAGTGTVQRPAVVTS